MSVKGYLAILPSLIMERDKDLKYRIYVTEMFRVLSMGKQFKDEIEHFTDWINPRKQDIRPPDEIALDIIQRAGLVVK